MKGALKQRVYIPTLAAVMSTAQNTESLERELEPQVFCCLSLQNPLMCDKEDCMKTFPQSWYDQEHPTLCEMVDAGFYCKGSGNHVHCFYCGEGLFCWKPCHNPWYKHIKWFPMCKFILSAYAACYSIKCETQLQQSKGIKDWRTSCCLILM